MHGGHFWEQIAILLKHASCFFQHNNFAKDEREKNQQVLYPLLAFTHRTFVGGE